MTDVLVCNPTIAVMLADVGNNAKTCLKSIFGLCNPKKTGMSYRNNTTATLETREKAEG